MVDETPSITSRGFDANKVLDSIINDSWKGDGEAFYSGLLLSLEDEELAKLVVDIKTSHLSLGRASHAVFLLPWAVQASLYQSQIPRLRNENAARQSQGIQINLKQSLRKIIARAKAEAQISERLLELRLTGFSRSKDLLHDFMRVQYAKNNSVMVVCNFRDGGSNTIWYSGKLALYDNECNILLASVHGSDASRIPFIFIR